MRVFDLRRRAHVGNIKAQNIPAPDRCALRKDASAQKQAAFTSIAADNVESAPAVQWTRVF